MCLSKSRDLKLAFNSLCGYASVNHLHFHLYYQSHMLPVQHLALTPVPDTDLHTLAPDTYPAPAWVWTLDTATDNNNIGQKITKVAESVHKLTDWLSNNDIAHNVFIIK